MSAQANQGTHAPGSVWPTQAEYHGPGKDDPTPLPMDSTDRFFIYYPEGGRKPIPNPDRNCVILKVDRAGKVWFERYVPRSRFPFGSGTIEQY